jgi:CheY-like chemotaxis protein
MSQRRGVGSDSDAADRDRRAAPRRFADRIDELRAALSAWRRDPDDEGLAMQFRSIVHRLSGLAQVQRQRVLSGVALELDTRLADWHQSLPQERVRGSDLLASLERLTETLLGSLAHATQTPVEQRRGSTGGPPLRALLVEDDPEQAEHWAQALRQCGLEVAIADDFTALETEIANHQPDVLVLDYWLDRRTTAADIALMLKRTPAAEALPKVCLTVDASTQPRYQGMRSGFAAVVRKSIGAEELADLLHEVVRNARRA